MKSRFVLHSVTALAFMLLPSVAFAQTWTGGAIDQNWSSADNWSTGVTPTSSGTTTVVLGLSGLTTAPVVDLNNPWALGSLTFSANHLSVSLTGNALQFTTGGSINDNVAGTFTDTISNNITNVGTGSLVISNGSTATGNLNITGSITSSNGVTLQGVATGSTISGYIGGAGTAKANVTSNGNWTISGTSNQIGTTGISSNTITLGANQALTSGSALAFQVAGSTPGALNLNGFNQTVSQFRNDNPGTSTLTNTSGTLSVFTINAVSSLNRTANTNVTGNLEIDKTGGNYQVLTGTNTYTGATKVSGGALYVNGTHTVTSGTTAAYIISSTGTTAATIGVLGGSGTINLSAVNQGITLGSGTQLDVGSAPATVGTLTASLGTGVMNISALSGSNGGELKFNLNTTVSSDKLSLTSGTLNIGSGLLDFADFSFTETGSFTPGSYSLFDTNQAITGSLAATGLTGVLSGYTSTLAISGDGQDILLNVAAVPEPSCLAMLLGGMALLSLMLKRRSRDGVSLLPRRNR